MHLYIQMPVVHTMSDGSVLNGPNAGVLLFCFAWAAWNPLHPQSYTWFSWASGDFFWIDDYPAVNFNSHCLAPGMEVSVYLPCCLTSRNPCFALGKILSALEEFFSYTFLASCYGQFLLCAQGSSGAPRGVYFCKPNSGLRSPSCTW